MRSAISTILVALFSMLAEACVLGPDLHSARSVAGGACCPPLQPLNSPNAQHRAEAPDMEASPAVRSRYTARGLDVARAIGALTLIERLSAAMVRGATDTEVTDLRGQVYDAIAMARLDIVSTIAHLACEEGRASEMAADLRAAEQAQTRTLTAYSLLISAAAAVAGGILAIEDKDQTPAGVVGIGGGVAGGGFGFATLAVHRGTEFWHTQNILGEVWVGGAHPSIPDVVWEYLTRPQFARSGDRTIRDSLVLAWRQSGRLGDDLAHVPSSRTALYFGEGGVYDADGLDDRVHMLSEMSELVNLMTYDLHHLATAAAIR